MLRFYSSFKHKTAVLRRKCYFFREELYYLSVEIELYALFKKPFPTLISDS